MKELENKSKDLKGTEISVQVEKQKRLLARVQPHRGHKVFEINPKTLEVREAKTGKPYAQLVKRKLPSGGYEEKTVSRTPLEMREGYDYVTALNKRNALKTHLRKIKIK